MRSFFYLSSLAVLAGCTPQLPEGRFVCAVDADCPPSWSCDTGRSRCVSSVVDTDAGSCTADQEPSADGCVDRNECATPNVCGDGQESCTNVSPGYACACIAGYVAAADGRSCENVDECTRGSDDCDWLSTCADSNGSFTCSCALGFMKNAGDNCIPSCNPVNDGDTGMRAFTAGHASLTGAGGALYGFDIDGLNNAALGTGGTGRTIPGCDKLDAANGVDNALGTAANSLSALVDLNALYDDALVDDAMNVSFDVVRLATGASADDACVGVSMTIDGASYVGAGALEDHVLRVMFLGQVSLPLPIVLPPASCNGNVCNPASVAFPLRGVRAELLFDSTNTTILDATVSGYAFFEDTTGAPGYDNSAGFKTAFETFNTASNIMPSLGNTFVAAFDGARDLHMQSDGSLADCSAPNGNANLVDRNSISIALHLTP